jgi:hypothetical protein
MVSALINGRARAQRARRGFAPKGPCLRSSDLGICSTTAQSVRQTMSLGRPRSTSDQRMTPRMAPVAFVDPTVPRAAKGGKTIEDKDKGKAEEGQDTYGEGGSNV